MSRFYLYDIGIARWLVDTKSKSIDSYCSDCCYKNWTNTFSKKDINGLIKRYQKPVYMDDSYVKDYFIYEHFMSSEEKSKCNSKPSKGLDKLIIESNDISEILKELLKEKVA